MLSSTYQSTARLLLSTLYEPLPKHLISVLAVALGRIFTFWIPSTDFIEDAILDSQQLRV